MAGKNPTINLIDWRLYPSRFGQESGEPKLFYIEKITNSIDYEAGSHLTAITVNDLINMGWAVNIRAPKNADF